MKKIVIILSIFFVFIYEILLSLLMSSVEKFEELALPTIASSENPTPNSYMELDKIPAEYDPKTATKNGDVVGLHGRGYNVKKLEDFVEGFKKKSLNIGDMIRITSYTIEGYAIIHDLIISNEGIKLIEDRTRNKFAHPSDRIKVYYNVIGINVDKRNNLIVYTVITDKGEELPLVTFREGYIY